ncbi:unnamed protein product [Caenorhabditis nigoni]
MIYCQYNKIWARGGTKATRPFMKRINKGKCERVAKRGMSLRSLRRPQFFLYRRYNTESKSTVPLKNNRVTAETGDITGTGETSNADLLAEIQKIRTELIAKNEENKRNQKDLESKIEDNKKNLNEISDKLQSVGALMSKLLKSNVTEKSDITTDVASSKSVKQFKLKHVFTNATNFAENVNYYSGRENHDNVNWYMCAKRTENHLGFYVYCEPIAPTGEWSIETKLEYKVVSRNQDVIIRSFEQCYQKSTGWGYPKFLEWDEMKNWCLMDGNLTLEAKVTITETIGLGKKKTRKFDESQKDFADGILVVGDTKFYVSKMFLAVQSSVFKTLLFGNFSESKQPEIKLNAINPDDFHYFLEILYGESAIDDTNVEDIASLADMYDAPTAIRKCEEFLLKESKKTSEKKLDIANRYNLERLKTL